MSGRHRAPGRNPFPLGPRGRAGTGGRSTGGRHLPTRRPGADPDAGGDLTVHTVRGTLWNGGTFFLSKFLLLISTLVLANLLAPDAFGLVAIGLVVVSYLDVVADLGAGPAVIYRAVPDRASLDRMCNTAFTIAVLSGGVLTVVLLAGAPLVAALFREPDATQVVRGLALAFLATTLGIIHDNRLKKRLDFRRRFVPEVARAVVKAGLQIGLALAGAGVWSLVWGQVAGAVVGSLLYWLVSDWRPRLRLEPALARELLQFGLPVTLLAVLGIVTTTVDQVMIGQRLDPAGHGYGDVATALGYYTIALRIPDLTVLSICYIVSAALFPAYSRVRDDPDLLRRAFRQTLRVVAVVVVPMGVGLVLVAPDLLPLLFGWKWTPSVPIMQWLAVYAVVRALSFNIGDLYKATGRPGVVNRLAVLRLVLLVAGLWFAAVFGLVAVAQAMAVVGAVLTVVELVVAGRLLRESPFRLAAEYLPALAAGAVLAGAVLAVNLLLGDADPWLRLAVDVIVGAAGYGLGLAVLAPRTFRSFLGLLRRRPT